MTARRTTNPWEPIYGDAIGPSKAQRSRSAVALLIVLVILGIMFAVGIGLAALGLLALSGASIG